MKMCASKGGLFYGCSQYPQCNGTRKPDGTRPGPADAMKKLMISWGLKKFQEIERIKIAGDFPSQLMQDA